jgi:hypothetical protein
MARLTTIPDDRAGFSHGDPNGVIGVFLPVPF